MCRDRREIAAHVNKATVATLDLSIRLAISYGDTWYLIKTIDVGAVQRMLVSNYTFDAITQLGTSWHS